jgi:hypothetical protein
MVTTTIRPKGLYGWPFLEQAWIAHHRGGEMPGWLPDQHKRLLHERSASSDQGWIGLGGSHDPLNA